jgi:hypothetical protein
VVTVEAAAPCGKPDFRLSNQGFACGVSLWVAPGWACPRNLDILALSALICG